ncbi:MAG: hypothetical protein WBN94_02240 [Methanothrix sp.]
MDGNENEFVNDIEEKLREKLPSNYILQKNANLFYQITLDNNLQPMVNFDGMCLGAPEQFDRCCFSDQ